MLPQKLKKGDQIAIIAPSRSLSLLSPETKKIANQRFLDLGLEIKFGHHAEESDEFNSASIASRVEDLHQAFSDQNIKAILTVIGGHNSNQLLRYLNWDLIAANPKIFCGFSDITALNNAIYAKTGLVTYSGPHYSSFGQALYFDYTLDYFKKCLFAEEFFEVLPNKDWSDDQWYIDQKDRHLIKNDGFWLINEGKSEGIILGANLCTFNLLQGAEYFPSLKNAVLFIEGDSASLPHTFDRDLQSLIHQPDFNGVSGIAIGRFQIKSQMAKEKLTKIIKTKKELDNLPIVANIDFGHTDPKITFPIGGRARLNAIAGNIKIEILEH
ncbi:MAG: LD-carboxypeptidase [bacterium]|nr:LD-carboxypeptidase [bacterium]